MQSTHSTGQQVRLEALEHYRNFSSLASGKIFWIWLDNDANKLSKVFWSFILFFGLGLTTDNILKCWGKYKSYPTITKPIYSRWVVVNKSRVTLTGKPVSDYVLTLDNSFPSEAKHESNHWESDHYMSHIKSFPKITICLNSIHSKEIATRLYGEKLTWDLAFLYGYVVWHDFSPCSFV